MASIEGLLLLSLLGEEHSLDVRQHTTLGDGHTVEKFVELLIVADSQLQVARDNPRLLVVAGSVASQLQNLSSKVLHDGGEVHGCTSADALGVVALAQKPVDTADGELQPSPRRAGL